MDARAARVVAFFEQLTPARLSNVDSVYAPDATFKDPFNDVRGTGAVRAVFDHMYRTLDAPRFVVHDTFVTGDRCMLTWDFHFRFKRFSRADQTIHGATHLQFDPEGRITAHRDYWDAAEELYEKLPAVGSLMRWLKRRASG